MKCVRNHNKLCKRAVGYSTKYTSIVSAFIKITPIYRIHPMSPNLNKISSNTALWLVQAIIVHIPSHPLHLSSKYCSLMLWSLATTNYGRLRPRIVSLWPQKCCGLRSQQTVTSEGRKWSVCDFNLATKVAYLATLLPDSFYKE